MSSYKKVSIIVPVYNVEKYLRECIESILAQTYKTYELILVDDGSPDLCPIICDEYARIDKRIKVIHKENGGISSARNLGLKEANGDYILFVDSDDYIEKNMLFNLVNIASATNADIVQCNYIRTKRGYKFENIDNSRYKYSMEDNTDAIKSLITWEGKTDSIVWNKLYKRSVIGNVLFDEMLCMNEDTMFNLIVYQVAKVIVILNAVSYAYVINENSIITKGLTLDKFVSSVKVYRYAKKLFEDCGEGEKWFYNGLFNWMIRLDSECKNNKEELEKSVIDVIKEEKKYIWSSKYISLHVKMLLLSTLVSSRIIKFYKKIR